MRLEIPEGKGKAELVVSFTFEYLGWLCIRVGVLRRTKFITTVGILSQRDANKWLGILEFSCFELEQVTEIN